MLLYFPTRVLSNLPRYSPTISVFCFALSYSAPATSTSTNGQTIPLPFLGRCRAPRTYQEQEEVIRLHHYFTALSAAYPAKWISTTQSTNSCYLLPKASLNVRNALAQIDILVNNNKTVFKFPTYILDSVNYIMVE